jgi:hypothetical protein
MIPEIEEMLKDSFITPEQARADVAAKAAEDALLSQGAHDEGNAQCVHLRYSWSFRPQQRIIRLAPLRPEPTGPWTKPTQRLERAATLKHCIARDQRGVWVVKSGHPDAELIKRCTPNQWTKCREQSPVAKAWSSISRMIEFDTYA